MKNFKILVIHSLLCVGVLFTFSSCEKKEGDNGSVIGGDTNLAINQVGTTLNSGLRVGNSTATGQLKVIDNVNGIITVEFSYPIPSSFVEKFGSLAGSFWGSDYASNASRLIDASNNFKGSFKFKNSSEGVAIIDKQGKQSVIMKYDVKAGDSWSYTKKNGNKVNMEVVHKSSDDDYFYSGMMIKAVKVERKSNETGVTKIVYIGNHRFGLVGVELYLDDGSITKLTF